MSSFSLLHNLVIFHSYCLGGVIGLSGNLRILVGHEKCFEGRVDGYIYYVLSNSRNMYNASQHSRKSHQCTASSPTFTVLANPKHIGFTAEHQRGDARGHNKRWSWGGGGVECTPAGIAEVLRFMGQEPTPTLQLGIVIMGNIIYLIKPRVNQTSRHPR